MDIPSFWRHKALWSYLLYPLSLMFRGGVFLRRFWRQSTLGKAYRAPVPVMIVGNLTVGGNGKTPLVIALAKALSEHGYRVGIISRGYGRQSQSALLVDAKSSADEVGDEPLLIHQQSALFGALPVAVCQNRQAAIELLLRTHPEVNVIVSDDGLQHYRLARDVELVAMASDLGFGNGFCLPAGALREPLSRLGSVDALVITDEGDAPHVACPIFTCHKALCVYELSTGKPWLWQDLARQKCAVLTAIARPKRFVDTLQHNGIQPVVIKTLPDHSPLLPDDLPDADAVLVTSKDAVKIRAWYQAQIMPPVYVVDYQLTPPKALLSLIIQKLKEKS